MAGSVNKVILIGALGRDPEIRTFQNGGRVANLSLATSERWTDRNSGEKRERTEWHRVAIMNENLIGVAEKYLRKGSKVYLEGQMETEAVNKVTGARLKADRTTTDATVDIDNQVININVQYAYSPLIVPTSLINNATLTTTAAMDLHRP